MILGVDPGARRVGLALADLETRFARPLEVVDTKEFDPIARIRSVIEEHGVTKVVVGRPVTLAGEMGRSAEEQKSFLVALRGALSVEVDVYDERLTTVIADRRLQEAGVPAAKRKAIKDAVAAQVMLQGYLDATA
ncbi:MAG: putative pre6S rRNA nuclease [Actinomycetota bacterium]|jgi:putative Holliday junction resolvase|nr:putative pre6S rRNA nuclease [Actinomycetota bacterium]